jgi:hypothetical protein
MPMLPGLSPVAGKSAVAKFDGGLLSSDGGLLLLREAEQSWLRLSEQFPANDKWRSAGLISLEGAGCWM